MQTKQNRIESIDALRGFALLGILWVNIYVFNAPYAHYSEFYGAFEGIDGLLVGFSSTFVAGKFMFIFAFLFGYGAYLQYSKMNNAKLFTSFWRRRMLGLALFGILHILLFWFGDILLPYAVLGFLIPVLVKQRVRALLITGIACYYSSIVFVFVEKWLEINVISIHSELSLKEFIRIYSSSSFIELFPFRMQEFWSLKNEKLAFYIPKEFALFCFGIAASKLKILEDYRPNPWQLIAALSAAIFFFSLRSFYFDWYQPDENPLIIPFLIAQNILFEILLAMSYILGFVYLYRINAFQKVFSLFVSVGRLSLSNYFLQSFFCVLIFYGYGLGLYGSLNPTQLLGLTIFIFSVQVVLSKFWLLKYRQGPLEYLWRKWSNVHAS